MIQLGEFRIRSIVWWGFSCVLPIFVVISFNKCIFILFYVWCISPFSPFVLQSDYDTRDILVWIHLYIRICLSLGYLCYISLFIWGVTFSVNLQVDFMDAVPPVFVLLVESFLSLPSSVWCVSSLIWCSIFRLDLLTIVHHVIRFSDDGLCRSCVWIENLCLLILVYALILGWISC